MVIREALSNALKHSAATEICFSVCFEATSMHAVLEDNGKGFLPKESHGFGNGLQNMRKRMSNLGGHFELRSEPGKGTRVTIRVPLAVREK